MIELPYLTEHAPFPRVEEALLEPNGLLAFGGELSVNRLFTAYSSGIFPWFSADEPVLWWSPDPRAIIELEHFHASRSLRKLINKRVYTVTMDHDFEQVIRACARVPRIHPQTGTVSQDTWITKDMEQAYINLHNCGLAHSVEVWDDDKLVGGLYGVAVGDVFCGESMFHYKTNTSKLALYALAEHMKKHHLAFIDCQLPTEHLASLGASNVSRDQFIARLQHCNQTLDGNGRLAPRYKDAWCKRGITP